MVEISQKKDFFLMRLENFAKEIFRKFGNPSCLFRPVSQEMCEVIIEQTMDKKCTEVEQVDYRSTFAQIQG